MTITETRTCWCGERSIYSGRIYKSDDGYFGYLHCPNGHESIYQVTQEKPEESENAR